MNGAGVPYCTDDVAGCRPLTCGGMRLDDDVGTEGTLKHKTKCKINYGRSYRGNDCVMLHIIGMSLSY